MRAAFCKLSRLRNRILYPFARRNESRATMMTTASAQTRLLLLFIFTDFENASNPFHTASLSNPGRCIIGRDEKTNNISYLYYLPTRKHLRDLTKIRSVAFDYCRTTILLTAVQFSLLRSENYTICGGGKRFR
jgi:hypothetical protein